MLQNVLLDPTGSACCLENVLLLRGPEWKHWKLQGMGGKRTSHHVTAAPGASIGPSPWDPFQANFGPFNVHCHYIFGSHAFCVHLPRKHTSSHGSPRLANFNNTSGRASYQKCQICQAMRILMEEMLWTDFGTVSQHGILENMLLAVDSLRSYG